MIFSFFPITFWLSVVFGNPTVSTLRRLQNQKDIRYKTFDGENSNFSFVNFSMFFVIKNRDLDPDQDSAKAKVGIQFIETYPTNGTNLFDDVALALP